MSGNVELRTDRLLLRPISQPVNSGGKMKLKELLSIREREQSTLLNGIVEVLEQDDRVAAAWLQGSLSRGDGDALSDIDLWVVVKDEAAREVVAGRQEYAALPAHPVLVMENVRNAPPEGAYLLALYPGEAGPQHVDWVWQPESMAQKPDDEKILLDRVGLPVTSGTDWRAFVQRPPGPALVDPRREEVLTQRVTFFWAMSVIVAKYIARRDSETVNEMTKMIAGTLDEIAELLDTRQSLPGRDPATESGVRSMGAEEQFNLLLGLARDATNLHDELADTGALVPTEALPYIHRFYELTQAMAMA